jgi:hypothetical protein
MMIDLFPKITGSSREKGAEEPSGSEYSFPFFLKLSIQHASLYFPVIDLLLFRKNRRRVCWGSGRQISGEEKE